MLDEAVTHDISTKVSSNLNELARQGLFIAPRAPFGYKKINKHKLGIDPMAALVVKRIFKFASEGVGLAEITRTLSEEGVLTPMEYATSKGVKGNYNTGTGKWSTRTIKDILVNITYAGHLCQGKDKITVLNTYDAIIEQALFDKVQGIINPSDKPVYPKTSTNNTNENPLKGKVICGCCGGKMQRRKGTGNADWYFFTCITNNRNGKGSCDGMYIRESAIIDKIKADIDSFIAVNTPIIKRMSAEKQIQRKSMYELHLEDQNISFKKRSFYEMMCNGEIFPKEYRERVDALTDNSKDIARLESLIDEMDKLRERYNSYVKARDGHVDMNTFIENFVDNATVKSNLIKVRYL